MVALVIMKLVGQRQFHQMGAEVFGSDSPYTDVEVVSSAIEILRKLGLNDLEVEITSLGPHWP